LLSQLFDEVLELQQEFSARPTAAMNRRRELIHDHIQARLTELVANDHQTSHLSVDASNGIGNNSVVPWIRVFNPNTSPSATSGWYLVFLISGDGSSVTLSLDLGVTKLKSEEILAQKRIARQKLEAAQEWQNDVTYAEKIDLRAQGNSLARLYESGNLLGVTFAKGQIPHDDGILHYLKDLSTKLALVESLELTSLVSEPDHDDLTRLSSTIHWPKDSIAEVLSSLTDSSPQIVLAGPPGTGKTFIAMEFARFVLGYDEPDLESRINLVQFHPTYGYEEFIEGLRPAVGSSGSVAFERVPGVLMEMTKAVESDGNRRVLIIDEMNRANLPRVFGELLYSLEYRDRAINLMLNQNFRLPRNLMIIGTMNTADKSIRAVDAAFRRRFDFFKVLPDVSILKSHFTGRPNSLGEELFTGFEALNNRLRSDIGEAGYEVGHSYFMVDLMSPEVLGRIWERQLFPLLEDYFAGQESILSHYKLREFWKID